MKVYFGNLELRHSMEEISTNSIHDFKFFPVTEIKVKLQNLIGN
jgi:hypothetical protein